MATKKYLDQNGLSHFWDKIKDEINNSSEVHIGNTEPIGNEVLWIDPNNVNGGYYDNYSTSEIRIGTWIDGKPLYRKTIIFENLNLHDSEIALSINVPNAYIRDLKNGFFVMTTGYRFPLNTYWKYSQAVSTIISNDNQSILIWCDEQNTVSSLIISVEYTKTTD